MSRKVLTVNVADDLALNAKARTLLDALSESHGLGATGRLVLTLDSPTDWWSLSTHQKDGSATDLAEGHGIASLLDAFCDIHNIEMVDL